MRTLLVVIDGQNDFCEGGALPVTGANQDMENISKLIRENILQLDLALTMDAHYPFNIAHSLAWVDKNGIHPELFTTITSEEVIGNNPKWFASNGKLIAPGHGECTFQDVQSSYMILRDVTNSPLTIWPYHCIIGTEGQTLHPALSGAVVLWEIANISAAIRHFKGADFFTEQLSAIAPEIPVESNPYTHLNHKFLDHISESDKILWAGEALDYCVKATINDTINELGEDSAKRMILLEDCTSAISESVASEFIDSFVKRGGRISTSDKVTV